MSDPRVFAIAGATLVALLIALWGHRRDRRRAVRSPLDLSGVDGRVVFFSDATCRRCDIVRAHLEALEATFTEIAYDTDPETHRSVGVTGVPLVVFRSESGVEERRFVGAVPKSRLALALGLGRS